MNLFNSRLATLAIATALMGLSSQYATALEATDIQGTCVTSDALPHAPGFDAFTTCGAVSYPRFSFQSDGMGVQYGLKITAPPLHCSAVNYQVYATYDQNHLLGKTRDFLNAGQSEIVPIGNDYARGLQIVEIRVLGKVGGCNEGRMSGWGARLELVIIP